MNTDRGPGQEHFKANYIEVIQRIVPEFYAETEYSLFGEEEDLQYNVLAKILYAAKNASGLFGQPVTTDLSSFSAGGYASATPGSGTLPWVPFFVPFNQKTLVTPTTFEKHVLMPQGKTWGSFENVEAFSSFMLTTGLSQFRFNEVNSTFATNYKNNVNTHVSSVGLVQDELLKNLGWVYILNTSGEITDAQSTPPSSVLLSSLNEDLFYGNTFTTETGVTDVFKWLSLNCQGGNNAWSDVSSTYLCPPFNGASATYNDNYWASGGQLVSALDTMVRVWVNEDDPNSLYFKDIVDASLLGLDVTRMENAGPMSKMLKALAYGFYDVKNTVRDIQFLLDIEECPEEFLQYLGRYLGWTFFTEDPAKWREQLKQAIYLYKAKGTRQALANATNMVIPSSIYNPSNDTSGLLELWETYFPNIIYYTIKTETDLGNNLQSYEQLANAWNKSLESSGIPIKIKNFDPVNLDNNARFLTDTILEYLNYSNPFLRIGGASSYTDTGFWNSQVSSAQKPAYYARGKNIAIPPWEEQRFYQNAALLPPVVKNFSSLLARPIDNLGLNLATSSCHTIGEYLASSTEIQAGDGFNYPGYGDNNSFKFYSSSLNLPFNYEDIIATGDVEAMSVFDYWNSKSSTTHSILQASTIDFEYDDFTTINNSKLGRRGIPAIIDVFRQFAPFHTLNQIFVGSSLTEDYYGTRAGYPEPGKAWEGVTDIEVINTLQDNAVQFNSTYTHDGFPGTMGTGGFSGISPSIYNPRQGRWIPSATLQPAADEASEANYFWSGGNDPTTAPSALKENLQVPRTASRRRNLKYNFVGWAQTRRGINQPIATNFFRPQMTVSAGGQYNFPIPPNSINAPLNISGFVPKGWNFSAQEYVSLSGDYSSVYSYYNLSSTPFEEFAASSFFPARGVADMNIAASSFAPTRDVFGSQILRALTNIFIRRGKEDSRWLNFSNQGFKNFKFGRGVTRLYQDYNTKFHRQLRNNIPSESLKQGTKYAGGFNILSHVFGPGLFNNNFSVKGQIIDNLSALPFGSLRSQFSISATNTDWSAIAAPASINDQHTIVGTDGIERRLSKGILQTQGYNTYENPFDTFERSPVINYSNGSLLSGIELVSPNVPGLAVWNSKENVLYNVDRVGGDGLTLITRAPGGHPAERMRVRFPLNGNQNYAYNGDFKFPPLDAASNSMSLSAVAGWQLCDAIRTPNINREGLAPGAAQKARINRYSTSTPASVTLVGRGRGAVGALVRPLGKRRNPALCTVVDVPDRNTPTNIRTLNPNTRYKLTMDVSSWSTGGTPYVTYALHNLTRNNQWIESDLNWSATNQSLSKNQVNTLASSTSDQGLVWREYTGYIDASAGFQKGDVYQLWVLPINTNSGSTHAIEVRNIKLEQVEAVQTGRFWNGGLGNKLFPNEEYNLNITSRSANMAQPNRVPSTSGLAHVYARVVVEQKPFVGNGWENFAKSWCYNWNTKMWDIASDGIPVEDEWKKIPVSSIESNTANLEFNTKNSRTPAFYNSRSDSSYLQTYFLSAGLVHNDESNYYVELACPEYLGDYEGITLLNVELINKNYNIYAQDYTRKDFQDVFEFFDTLSEGKASRDARDSSGTYLWSGGSRSDHLEYWGGSHSSTNGIYGFVENEG